MTRHPVAYAGFVHQLGLYGSDDAFAAMAVPFVTEGLAVGDPVLAVTTPANLDLLGHALGDAARDIDYAETAYFGRRPIQRIAAFHAYWKRQAKAGHARARILAEPIWAGRSQSQVDAWTRMESSFNIAMAHTGIHMICPYDVRITDPHIIANAHRTHCERMFRGAAMPCRDYTEPRKFVREYDTVLPPPPSTARTLRTERDWRALRRFVGTVAEAHGLPGERVNLLVLAAGQVVGFLAALTPSSITIRIWTGLGDTMTCELSAPVVADPLVGLLPLGVTEPGPGDAVWLARQICESLEIRSDDSATTVRMSLPGRHAEELNQSSAQYLC